MAVEVGRKALLKGDLEIWLKETKYVFTNKNEVCTVKQFGARQVVVIEMGGVCYVSLPFDTHTVQGMLYETRDSFDELVAQYQGKEIAGSNASETEEQDPQH